MNETILTTLIASAGLVLAVVAWQILAIGKEAMIRENRKG
jgi:hypothetical protein